MKTVEQFDLIIQDILKHLSLDNILEFKHTTCFKALTVALPSTHSLSDPLQAQAPQEQ